LVLLVAICNDDKCHARNRAFKASHSHLVDIPAAYFARAQFDGSALCSKFRPCLALFKFPRVRDWRLAPDMPPKEKELTTLTGSLNKRPAMPQVIAPASPKRFKVDAANLEVTLSTVDLQKVGEAIRDLPLEEGEKLSSGAVLKAIADALYNPQVR
jgi:hypothetical protein